MNKIRLSQSRPSINQIAFDLNSLFIQIAYQPLIFEFEIKINGIFQKYMISQSFFEGNCKI